MKLIKELSYSIGRLVNDICEGFNQAKEDKIRQEKIEEKVKEISPPTQ